MSTDKRIKYLIDSNVFIQAAKLYYQYGFCPGYWDWIKTINPDGMLSIKQVYSEIVKGNDWLKSWVLPQKKSFVDFDASSAVYIQRIRDILIRDNIDEAKINEFLDGTKADAYLLAYAKAHDCIVISHEVTISKIKTQSHKVQIPNVALDLGVKVIPIYNLMRQESNYNLKLFSIV